MGRSRTGGASRAGRAISVCLGLLVASTVLAAAWLALDPGVSLAATAGGCGSLPSGTGVYVNCAIVKSTAPYATFSDGQLVNLAMGPNTLFAGSSAGASLVAIECEYSTGDGPGDPPDTNYCSAQTAASDFPYAAHANGSFDYALDKAGDQVSTYALPDATFPGATITCNATHPCVWYVGENYNDFTAPHVFSNPFFVTGSAPNPESPPGTAAAVSIAPSTPPAPVSGQLAYTGTSPFLIGLACIGFVILLIGAVGRMVVARSPR